MIVEKPDEVAGWESDIRKFFGPSEADKHQVEQNIIPFVRDLIAKEAARADGARLVRDAVVAAPCNNAFHEKDKGEYRGVGVACSFCIEAIDAAQKAFNSIASPDPKRT